MSAIIWGMYSVAGVYTCAGFDAQIIAILKERLGERRGVLGQGLPAARAALIVRSSTSVRFMI